MRKLASLKLTVTLLLAVFFVVFFGTIYQVKYGLYEAQTKVFNSPLSLILISLLFVNLLSALFLKFKLDKIGILISHFGLILLLMSGFLNLNFSQEGFIELKEGEMTNKISDYHKWQLNLRKNDQEYIIPEKDFAKSKLFKIERLYSNALIFHTPFAGDILKELEINKIHEKNNLGLILNLDGEMLALASNENYQRSKIGTEIRLNRETRQLPFRLELVSTSQELYPQTEIAKSYLSKVKIKDKESERELSISMNKPFRHGLYTLYQSGYGINEKGEKIAVFAAVKNLCYMLPYIATILTGLGLALHFLFQKKRFFNV